MEGPNESYSKFKTFLNVSSIRSKAEGFNVDDFQNKQFDYMQPHLEKLLPLLSIEEAKRINIYFNNAYIFHLSKSLRIANIFPQKSLNPEPSAAQNDNDDATEPLRQCEQLGPETGPVDDSELSSQQLAQEHALHESDCPIYSKNTGPLMQSTPLSVPLFPEENRMHYEEQNLREAQKEVFTANVISQINISPIPMHSAPTSWPNVQPTSMPAHNVKLNEVTFLRNFAHIETEPNLEKQHPALNIRPRIRKRTINVIEQILEPKKKINRIKFDVLCNLPLKNKTDAQITRSEESFVYFSLMSRKTDNILSKIISNTITPEGERGHISMERIINFSNVLRAHANQSQTPVEQPVQIYQINSSRSPCTPQGLLRTSNHLPFTPLRGDISGLAPRMVIDQATSLQSRSLLRQQPLLPIPERESSVNIPFSPHFEEDINLPIDAAPQPQNISIIPLPLQDDPAASINIVRDAPENADILNEQLLEIAYNNPTESETQQNKVSLNNSSIIVEPLIEQGPIVPSEVIPGELSCVPENISENFEIIVQPQPQQVNSITLPQETLAKDREMENCDGLVSSTNVLNQQPISTEVVPIHLQQSIAQEVALDVDGRNDNLHFSWFEILRPRGDLVEYPQESGTPRRKKRRRRRRVDPERVVRPRPNYELPVIPTSTSHENINELAVGPVEVSVQIPPNQELMSLEDQLGLDHVTQNIKHMVSDLPENPLSPPTDLVARYSEEQNGISDQITQYPLPIETQFGTYLELLKGAGKKLGYADWEYFDTYLFNENDCFALYTNIFKKILKDKYVAMEKLFENGTTRLEAAKGFRFVLDLKTLGVIEIESIDTRIIGILLKSGDDKMCSSVL